MLMTTSDSPGASPGTSSMFILRRNALELLQALFQRAD
jgi:hypothetical protein